MATNDDLSAALEALKLEDKVEKSEKVMDEMINKLEKEDVDKESIVPKLVENGILQEIHKLLNKDGAHKTKAAQLAAELAKVESIRRFCVEAGLVPCLLDLMETSPLQNTMQACRALGNICFDNDDGRAAVDEVNGVSRLLRTMKTYLGRTGEGTNKLRIVLCGFLLNLTNTHGMHLSSCNVQRPFGVQKVIPTSPDDSDNVRMITLRLSLNPNASEESLQEKVISQGALELLEDYLRSHGNDTGTAQMALLTIGSLTDAEAGRAHLSDCEVAVTVGNLLASDVSKDLQDTVLDLLGNLAESDEVKAQLAHSDVPSHLVKIIRSCENTSDEESLAMGKLTSDLIVLLLSGDPSMDILYNNGKGEIFREAMAWLKSPSDHLQMCGALAMGNFARNDQQCLYLVKNGITEQLLALLSAGPEQVDPTLQHAVFSALRNLAIPPENKSKMLDCKLLDVVLQYKDTDMTVVQFKLLGLLRMVVDKQGVASQQLGCNEDFVKRLMEWCAVEDHAGVKGEANRLVAWLVKNSPNVIVVTSIVKHGGVPFLVNMANAEHAVMQNEALVALTLIASTALAEAVDSFVSADLIPTIKVILTDEESLSEIISNVCTLIKGLSPSEKMIELLTLADIPDVIKKLKGHEDKMVRDGAKGIAAIFDRG